MNRDANDIAMDNRFEAVVSASLIHHSRRLFKNRFLGNSSDTLSSSSDYQLTRKHKQEIRIETNKDDPSFLKEVEDKLQQSVKNLNEKFLVLSTEQINYLSYRLHAVLQPKRSPETQLIETWAIQSRDHIENLNMNAHTQPLQRHHSGHITVLKLSTILSKVKCLHIYQQQSEMIEAADLEIFPSLDAIEIRKMDAKVLSHLYLFAQTLETLCVEQIRIKCLRQVLFNEWESRDWKVLNALTIRSCDEFGIIDASINSLKAITSIDFGWNRITSITCTLECSSLKHLCLCHNQLSELPAMNSLTQLETLNLSMNQLHTLEGMQYLKSLKFLDISWNRLDGIREIEILRPLRSLRHINVKENPFTRRPDYRREVLFYLGDHVELDGKRWSFAETDSMAKCRKLESIIQEDLDNDIEYDSTASGPPTGSKETFEVALEYPVLEATSYSNHKGDVELTDISNPGFSYQTHIFFHPRFSQNQRGPYTVDDFFRQDDGTKRMVDQADIEALRLRSECHTVFGRETTHSFENDPIRGRKASISWSTDNANDTAQIISSRRTFSSHEAQMYQLKPDEGVVCSLQFQPGTIIESYQVQLPTADPSKFFWDLTELVSVGLSIQMNENLIATRYSKSTTNMRDATYGFQSVEDLKLVLRHIVTSAKFVKMQYSTRTLCIECGAISLLSQKHIAQSNLRSFDRDCVYDFGKNDLEHYQSHGNSPLQVVYCLFCGSGNVRLISLDLVQKHLSVDLMDRHEATFGAEIDSPSALYVESNRYDRENISHEPIQKCIAKLSASSGIYECSKWLEEDGSSERGGSCSDFST